MRYYEKAESEIKLEAKIENVLTELARLLLIREVNEKNTREEFNTRIIRRYKRHDQHSKHLPTAEHKPREEFVIAELLKLT